MSYPSHTGRFSLPFTAAVALLGLVSIQGCENDGLEPTVAVQPVPQFAKSGHHGGSGSTGGSSSTIAVAESGAVTAGSTTFDVWTDNGKKLSAGTGSAPATLAFTNTLNSIPTADPLSVCALDGGRNTTVPLALVQRAVSKLASPELGRALSMSVDKGALGGASADHHLGGTWQDADGQFDFGVGTVQKLGDPATVDLVSGDIGANSELRYHGGTVEIKDRSGSASFSVICPNLDVVDVTVTR